MIWLGAFVTACLAGACYMFYRAGFEAGVSVTVAEWRKNR